jgi:hypothetical protein
MTVAFLLFSITHLLTLLDLAQAMFYPIVVLRFVGYLLIVFMLYKILTQPK